MELPIDNAINKRAKNVSLVKFEFIIGLVKLTFADGLPIVKIGPNSPKVAKMAGINFIKVSSRPTEGYLRTMLLQNRCRYKVDADPPKK